MSLGQLARSVLGDRLFQPLGNAYRGLFVDVEKVIDSFPPLDSSSHVLDIGGGDGSILDAYLSRYPGARATMIDLSPTIGMMLSDEVRRRVELNPGVAIAEYAESLKPTVSDFPTPVIVSDVVHHLPEDQRSEFFADLALLLEGERSTLVVKEVEPGSLRARLAYLADRYISGDRSVSFIGSSELRALVAVAFGDIETSNTDLIGVDPPNYCVQFHIGA